MPRDLIFLPEIAEDFSVAFSFYEELAPARGGARFEAALRVALNEIKRGIITHRLCFKHYHRVLLSHYPYTLYYRIRNDRAVIVAVLYSKFSPAKIQSLLKKRE